MTAAVGGRAALHDPAQRVFRAVDRYGDVATARLSDRSVADIVKRSAEWAGLDLRRAAGLD